MTIAIEEPSLQSYGADFFNVNEPPVLIPQQRQAEPAREIGVDDVDPFVEPGLDNNDLRLLARLAKIAQRGGSATLMRCLGIAARNPDEIPGTLERFTQEPPPDAFVIESLEAALAVYNSGIERRARPSTPARQQLMNSARYQQLLDVNRRNPTDRTVQYYALGKIAGMVASAIAASPVQ